MFRLAKIAGVRRVINDNLIDDLRILKYKAEPSAVLCPKMTLWFRLLIIAGLNILDYYLFAIDYLIIMRLQ